jgi:regulator of protease activity HflC (stomatin/prohibitin superfamily)
MDITQDTLLTGIAIGLGAYLVLRYVIFGFFTVDQNERAVLTSCGRAERILGASSVFTPEGEQMRDDEKERYAWPQLRVLGPGVYFRLPWQRVHKVSIATRTLNMAYDPDYPGANQGGTVLEAITKDQLNTGLSGQIRFRVSEQNLYPFLFAVKRPISHVMGFFVSILRERIANFEAPKKPVIVDESEGASKGMDVGSAAGVSINDLRKNLREVNEHMDRECGASAARYGVVLEASLITSIDPPEEVESALAAINTAHNQVSSDISLAQAGADQKIVQSRRAVEIQTLHAQAEVEPLTQIADQLTALKSSGPGALAAYLRNVRLSLFSRAERVITEVPR